jgi:hypothetical protein
MFIEFPFSTCAAPAYAPNAAEDKAVTMRAMQRMNGHSSWMNV